ncbi:MAG: hypothetical protein ACK4VI_05035 [Alphaproteobacteria bacterium]
MFWSKEKNNSDKQKKKPVQGKALQVDSGVHQESANSKSQRIREEALANARYARAEIGEETLNKIAALMTQKQQSNMEQAKRTIAEQEADRVAGEILLMLEDKH